MTVSEHRIAQMDSLLERSRPDASSISGEWPQHEIPVRPAAEKMRILFTINSLEGGGAERIFTLLVNSIQPHLDTAEIEVLLLDDKVQRYQITAPVRVSCLQSNGSLKDGAIRFKRYLDSHRPHLVISFLTRTNYLAAAFAGFYGYRCIISERSDTSGRLGSGISGWIKRLLVRSVYPRAHKIIAVSGGIKQSLAADYGVSPDAISVIHNPCNLEELDQWVQQPCQLTNNPLLQEGFILAVGRLVNSKRFEVLIRAYAQGGFKLPLVILGEGPTLADLQALASRLGVHGRVLFPGFLSNPHAVMARASLYVLCSELEGFPNSLVEAMGVGLPVIATNCNHGPAEILDETVTAKISGVHQGKYGLLVPVGDAHALTTAMHQVLTNPAQRASMAERSRHRAAHFAVQVTVGRYAAVINEQLALVARARG